MHPFTIAFIAFLLAGTALQWWLASRQRAHVRAHENQVPLAFAEKISLDNHRKAAQYTFAKTSLGQKMLLVEAVLLLAWTLGGLLQGLDELWRGLGWSELWTGVAFLVSVGLISSLLDLPASLYRTFSIEQRFGFNRSTVGLFVSDMLKSMLLSLALGVPLLALILWLMESAGANWWLWAWGVWFGFNLFLMWAFPAFIAPMFNRIEPLQNDDLKARIERILQRNGFTSGGVFVMDGSRRSGHGNAYFAGLGKNKRIVLFDTLLTGLEAEEVEAVLAHEVGHFARRHLQKRLIFMALFSLAGLALLAWLMQQAWFYSALGMSQHSTYAALALFSLAMPVFMVFFSPLLAWMSRRHEFEADAFAAMQTNPATLIHALVKMYRDNASTLTPDPLYSAFYDSHPPAPVRVAQLRMQN